MNDNSYNNKVMAGAMPQSEENASFIDQISSKICDQLEGIEKTSKFKIASIMLYSAFSLITFDIISDGSLMKLFFAS